MTSATKTQRNRAIAYWVATAVLLFELIVGGFWDVLRVPHVRAVMERVGYPAYFIVILGIWKLLGAVALLIPRFPRLKEWAYAGVIFSITGALISHVASRDIEVGPMVYLVVMLGVTAASWSLRPPSRRNFPPS
ncbi:MAG TPA: DoxX family protein [Phycisphaerae bacterium]|nr:DoxX family protein [Phycisphaerae bacterium]